MQYQLLTSNLGPVKSFIQQTIIYKTLEFRLFIQSISEKLLGAVLENRSNHSSGALPPRYHWNIAIHVFSNKLPLSKTT